MFCPKCGKEIKDNAKFCNFCGETIKKNLVEVNAVTENTQVSTVITAAQSIVEKPKSTKANRLETKVSTLESVAQKRMVIFAVIALLCVLLVNGWSIISQHQTLQNYIGIADDSNFFELRANGYPYINNYGNLPYYDDFYDKEVLSTLNLKDTSDERDVVLVMDVSGSMSGTKLSETKNAASKFIDTVLATDASISIVTYSNGANIIEDFSKDKTKLNESVNSISANGGTNIEAGLKLASEQMYYSHAKKKIIVLMSDGEPNDGKVGDELVKYAESIKSRGVYLYTLGFFDNGSNRTQEQILMEELASEGCHYEVSVSNNLVFFFDDIANMIRGQQFIYVKIACPVEVSVSFNGETISSMTDGNEQRAMFGTLTKTLLSDDEEAKILRLKAENEYDIQIIGTGTGTMDYMVALMDENGDYNDFRVFENVNILDGTNITSTVNNSDSTQMIVDEDGDGKTDYTYMAGQNQMGRKVINTYVYLATYSALALGIVLSLLVIVATKKRKEKVEG